MKIRMKDVPQYQMTTVDCTFRWYRVDHKIISHVTVVIESEDMTPALQSAV